MTLFSRLTCVIGLMRRTATYKKCLGDDLTTLRKRNSNNSHWDRWPHCKGALVVYILAWQQTCDAILILAIVHWPWYYCKYSQKQICVRCQSVSQCEMTGSNLGPCLRYPLFSGQGHMKFGPLPSRTRCQGPEITADYFRTQSPPSARPISPEFLSSQG